MVEKAVNPADMWDERFARPEPVYGEEPNAFFRAQATARLKAAQRCWFPVMATDATAYGSPSKDSP